ncbi:HNH endonuclease [Chelativorans xinjiangense]|uniref:HNH endonuclease n=1 Tax=Chelativorans xinjiangense TaxID=2681485 RepID=UPI00135B388B|nr:HNH endonuclease signature motif containing protein [Chelativorans xinjiangense]
MARREFTKATRRAALERSQGRCEAIGAWYGLEPGKRCNAPLSAGVEFDHIDLDANSKDNSLSNCAATCIPCHRHKSAKHDTPKAAKTLRQQDKARGVSKPAGNLKSRPSFPKPSKPERQGKQPLPPRKLFEAIS